MYDEAVLCDPFAETEHAVLVAGIRFDPGDDAVDHPYELVAEAEVR